MIPGILILFTCVCLLYHYSDNDIVHLSLQWHRHREMQLFIRIQIFRFITIVRLGCYNILILCRLLSKLQMIVAYVFNIYGTKPPELAISESLYRDPQRRDLWRLYSF